MKVTLYFDKDNSHLFGGNSKVFGNVTTLTPHNAYGFLEIVTQGGVRVEYNLTHILWFQVEGS